MSDLIPRCIFCNFINSKCIRYRGKAICHRCLIQLWMVAQSEFAKPLERYIKQEVRLDEYGEQ